MITTLPADSRPAPQDQPAGKPGKTSRPPDPRYLALRNFAVSISVFNVLGYAFSASSSRGCGPSWRCSPHT